jgi:hypothetical protein
MDALILALGLRDAEGEIEADTEAEGEIEALILALGEPDTAKLVPLSAKTNLWTVYNPSVVFVPPVA